MRTGRPRIQSIPRFNIATDVTSGRKFLHLQRILRCSEEKTLFILVRFWQYIAQNYAFTAQITECDFEILEAWCNFPEFSVENSGKEIRLIPALQKAGFLDADLTVHEWQNHQPLAEKIQSDRERKSKEEKEKDRLFQTFPEKSTEKVQQDKITLREDNYKREEKSSQNFDWNKIYTEIQNDFLDLHNYFNAIPAIKKLNDARKKLIQARWKEDGFDWKLIVKIVRSSPFLRGESPPRNGLDKPFAFNFDFVFARSSRWLDIIEGKYGLPETQQQNKSTHSVYDPNHKSTYEIELEKRWEAEEKARKNDPEAAKKTTAFLNKADKITAAKTGIRSGKIQSAADVLNDMAGNEPP